MPLRLFSHPGQFVTELFGFTLIQAKILDAGIHPFLNQNRDRIATGLAVSRQLVSRFFVQSLPESVAGPVGDLPVLFGKSHSFCIQPKTIAGGFTDRAALTSVAIVAGALIAGRVIRIWQALIASKQRALAEQSAGDSDVVLSFFEKDILMAACESLSTANK